MNSTRAALVVSLAVFAGCRPAPQSQSESELTAASTTQPAGRTDPSAALTVVPSAAPTAAAPSPAASPSAMSAPLTDTVVARVNGDVITAKQLYGPLIEAYGLNLLLNLVQLDLAKQDAARQHIAVTPEDVRAELEMTEARMFKDAAKEDYPGLLDQFLTNQRLSRPEFDIVIEINAYLRKIAEPLLKNKISEENLQEAFRQLYGETVQVRHIQCSNLQEVAEVKRRLAAGEAFEAVAKALSRNARTGSLGGELPPFSRSTTGLPQAFKDAAFGLKPGEVSDPVQAEDAYHVIKLERRFAPKAVKFEDVKESIREDLYDRLVQATVKDLRSQLVQQTVQSMQIENPVLKRQFTERMDKQKSQTQDRDQIRKQLERDRERLTTSRPALPAAAPTTLPDAAP